MRLRVLTQRWNILFYWFRLCKAEQTECVPVLGLLVVSEASPDKIWMMHLPLQKDERERTVVQLDSTIRRDVTDHSIIYTQHFSSWHKSMAQMGKLRSRWGSLGARMLQTAECHPRHWPKASDGRWQPATVSQLRDAVCFLMRQL